MRRRIGNAADTHLGGNSAKCKLPNTFIGCDEEFRKMADDCLDDALTVIYKNESGFDFKVRKTRSSFEVLFGLEPNYKGQKLVMYCIHSIKEKSYILQGEAHGYYGKCIRYEPKAFLVDCENKDFVDFVEKWHPHLTSVFEK